MSGSSNTGTPQRSGGLSLYANLLDPTATTAASISKGPVVFKPAESSEEKKPGIDSGKYHLRKE